MVVVVVWHILTWVRICREDDGSDDLMRLYQQLAAQEGAGAGGKRAGGEAVGAGGMFGGGGIGGFGGHGAIEERGVDRVRFFFWGVLGGGSWRKMFFIRYLNQRATWAR